MQLCAEYAAIRARMAERFTVQGDAAAGSAYSTVVGLVVNLVRGTTFASSVTRNVSLTISCDRVVLVELMVSRTLCWLRGRRVWSVPHPARRASPRR
jgi:hypothetical protein